MNDRSFSEILRELSKTYYQQHIGLDEYRARRKEVLDIIDAEFNGYEVDVNAEGGTQEEVSFISKAFGLFKPNDDI